jgi:hypothetical protein
MVELRSRMPYADLDRFDNDRRLSVVPDLFTVDLVARYIAWKFGQGAATGLKDHGTTGITQDPSPVH